MRRFIVLALTALCCCFMLSCASFVLAQPVSSQSTPASSLDSELIKLVVSGFVGSLFGIITAFFTANITTNSRIKDAKTNFEFKVKEIEEQFNRELKKERAKWQITREDAIIQELRIVIQQVTIKMAAAMHSMTWLTWIAKEDVSQITIEKIKLYNEEQNKLLPEILGFSSSVAALDKTAYDLIAQIINDIFILDSKIGKAGLQFEKSPSEGGKALFECYKQAVSLEEKLPQQIGNIVSERVQQRAEYISKLREDLI
ncbi:hypothetical protein H6G64_35860 [Calothrix sp. FACHB-156]|nr:hypothetical protein [Calothrix membranacea FACHB-236]MBD2342293.1 hypothetical protein [Calothrix sp. FACHB-156]